MQGNVTRMYALILSAKFPCFMLFITSLYLFSFPKYMVFLPFISFFLYLICQPYFFLSICQLHILLCVHLIFNFPWSFIFIQPLIYYSSYILLFTRCCFSFQYHIYTFLFFSSLWHFYYFFIFKIHITAFDFKLPLSHRTMAQQCVISLQQPFYYKYLILTRCLVLH